MDDERPVACRKTVGNLRAGARREALWGGACECHGGWCALHGEPGQELTSMLALPACRDVWGQEEMSTDQEVARCTRGNLGEMRE